MRLQGYTAVRDEVLLGRSLLGWILCVTKGAVCLESESELVGSWYRTLEVDL